MPPEPARPEPIRSRACSHWRVDLLPRQPYETRFTAQTTTIGYAFDSQSGNHAFASDRVRPFRVRAQTLAVVPSGCDVYSHSGAGGEYLTITPLAESLLRGARQITDSATPSATHAARALRALLLADAPVDPLEIEAHAMTLAQCGQSPDTTPPANAARWMTPQRLKRIAEIVDTLIETGPTVADLAAALQLSPDFLCRAFKAAIGQTPHAYILDRRLARARAMIHAGTGDLSEIAYASGFSSHAHMSSAFRQRLGVTPRAFRAALR